MHNLFLSRAWLAVAAFMFVLRPVDGAAPYAYTAPQTMLTSTNVVLNGMATPNGEESMAWFEWGTNKTYGNRTELLSVGTGNSVVFMTNKISGLTDCAVHHFRLVVSNSCGVAYGADRKFAHGQKCWAWGENASGQIDIPIGTSNVVSVAAGTYSSLALKDDGTIVGWGQLNAFYGNIPSTPPEGLSDVVAVAASGNYCMALKSDGTVEAWGGTIAGGPPLYYIPAKIPAGLKDVVAIDAGGEAVALKRDGTVVSFVSDQPHVPEGVSNAVAVAAGALLLALKNDGTVCSWNSSHQAMVVDGLSNVVAISCNGWHALALKRDGTVVAWGENENGQTNVPLDLTNVVAISGGEGHSMALTDNGNAVGWGYNYNGQLNVPAGLSNITEMCSGYGHNLAIGDNGIPVVTGQKVTGAANNDTVVWLSGTDPNGDSLSFSILTPPASGKLYQLGENGRGAVIDTTNTPVLDQQGRVIFAPNPGSSGTSYAEFQFAANDGESHSGPAQITMDVIAAPFASTLDSIVRSNSAVLRGMVTPNGYPSIAWFEWGNAGSNKTRTEPVNVEAGGNVVYLESFIHGIKTGYVYQGRAAISNCMGITYGCPRNFGIGRKICDWGQGFWGDAEVPADLTNVVAISAGYNHLALRDDGTVVAWGDNSFGQSDVPVGLSNVISIAAGAYGCMALKMDGTVITWPENSSLQNKAPAAATNVVSIAVGWAHYLALRKDGSIIAWGEGCFGETNVPPALNNVVAIAAGGRHSLALQQNGDVVPWGWPKLSALTNAILIGAGIDHAVAVQGSGNVVAWGANDQQQTNVPSGLADVISIAAGATHNLILKKDGAVVSWGYNANGVSNPRAEVVDVIAIAGGYGHSMVLQANQLPLGASQTVIGAPNQDCVIWLSATDADQDPLTYKIISLPSSGTLWQFAENTRGSLICTNGTSVTDPAGRIIFVPGTNVAGAACANFQFIANDTLRDSAPASVNISIVPPFSIPKFAVEWQKSSYRFSFVGVSNGSYSAWASTNLIDWEQIDSAVETSPGSFEFSDEAVTNYPHRFYQLRWP